VFLNGHYLGRLSACRATRHNDVRVVSTSAGSLTLAAAELSAALGALPRLVAPLHRRGGAQAALDGSFDLLRGHKPTLRPGPTF